MKMRTQPVPQEVLRLDESEEEALLSLTTRCAYYCPDCAREVSIFECSHTGTGKETPDAA